MARWCAPSSPTWRTTTRWAKSWEFQALLKARPIAGDLELGNAVRGAVAPEGVVERLAGELRRVRAADARAGHREHPGGRGRRAAQARAPAACATSSSPSSCCSSCTARPIRRCVSAGTTRRARTRSAERGYIGRAEAAEFARDYRVPAAAGAPAAAAPAAPHPPHAARAGRAAGAGAGQRSRRRAPRSSPSAVAAHQARRARAARAAVLPPAARRRSPPCPRSGMALSQRAGRGAARGDRLRATRRARCGTSRRSRRECRGERADPAQPAAGDARSGSPRAPTPTTGCWRSAGSASDLGETPLVPADAARLVAAPPSGSPACCRARGSSATCWSGSPSRWPGSRATTELRPRPLGRCSQEARAIVTRHARDQAVAAGAVRRCAAARCCGSRWRASSALITVEELAGGLTTITEDSVLAACCAVRRDRRAATGSSSRSSRWGATAARELGFGSDADVMYVYRAARRRPAGRAASGASRSSAALSPAHRGSCALPLDLDIGLRPEGKNGAVVRSLDSYRAYYAALVADLGGAGAAARPWRRRRRELLRDFEALADEVRYPAADLRAGRAGDQAHQGAGRDRAAAAGRRSGPAPEARPRLAQRRRVVRAAAAAAARRTHRPRCAPPRRWRRWPPRREENLVSGDGCEPAARGVAVRLARPVGDDPVDRRRPPTCCPDRGGNSRASPG